PPQRQHFSPPALPNQPEYLPAQDRSLPARSPTPGGVVNMRFGRSRVQDRARNSDVETVTEEPSAQTDESQQIDQSQELAPNESQPSAAFDSPDDPPLWGSSLFVDSHLLTEAEGTGATRIDANEPDSISDDSLGDGTIDE